MSTENDVETPIVSDPVAAAKSPLPAGADRSDSLNTNDRRRSSASQSWDDIARFRIATSGDAPTRREPMAEVPGSGTPAAPQLAEGGSGGPPARRRSPTRQVLTTTDARQGSRSRLSYRVLVNSLVLIGFVGVMAAAIAVWFAN
ncbi:MAG: hypothetical protein NW217_10260 [Hyphomicrobiaceae bacterium]|nr:hypothetical protein [Hyphomicrobiaceae bacterium]